MERMLVSVPPENESINNHYDRAKEVKAFDDTKAGVKGLVDSGVTQIPSFFIHPPDDGGDDANNIVDGLQVPVIDFAGFDQCSTRRVEIVHEIAKASETWGFFQMVNHGIPISVLDEMLAGVKRFHEQPQEAKRDWYTRDTSKRVRYVSNGGLFLGDAPAEWKDTIAFDFQDGALDPKFFPQICREAVSEYKKHVEKLSKKLGELLSEALGLPQDCLSRMECMESQLLVCHYYPLCPQPELTRGLTRHTDPFVLTVLLQDTMGGLQFRHNQKNQWIDVAPLRGALTVIIGDFLQLLTNDKFKSAEHRVLLGRAGTRVSVVCFFQPSTDRKSKPYGAIKELLSDNNPPIYRETRFVEYMAYFRSKSKDICSLSHFKQH